MKTIRIFLLTTLLIVFSKLSFGQGTETFTNLTTTSATSYLTRNWTGDNGLAWSSTDSRADQTLTGTAVTLRNGSVTCNTIPGGCGTLTFNYKRAFTGNSTLKVFINGVQYGATITVSSTTPTLASIPVNVAGNFNLELRNATKRTVIDDVSWTAMASCTAPTVQASAMSFSAITSSSMTVNWTRGNGTAGVIVVAKLNTSTLTDPTSGTTYTANAVFGSGTQIGVGNYVVYQGTGTSVNVTGLANASNYNFAVYEYNTISTCYNLTELAGLQSTTCTAPSSQATLINFSAVTSSSLTIGWTRGNGAGILAVVKQGSAVSTNPTGGTVYTANTIFGSGTQIGVGNYVVYQGTGTSVTITGLTSGTTYYVALYEYNGTGGTCYNLTPLTGNQTTLTAPCINEGFETGIPGTWTATSVTTISNATNAHTGTFYANFNSSTDKLRTDIQTNPNVLTFWVRASGTTSNFSFNVEYSTDAITWTSAATYSANGANSGAITTTYSQKSITLGLTGNYYIRFTQNPRTGGSCYLDDVQLFCSSGPEINIKQGVTNYLTGSSYNFGSAAVGSNNDIVFTIENTGSANLTITTPLTGSGDYTIFTQPTSPVIAGGTTTFTVRFTPSIAGTRTGAVTISNNDSNEGSYVINFTGVGVAGSSTSDIIANTTFTYPTNINYTLYPPTANITTTNSIEVYQFDIRDGGAVVDADALSTILNNITFGVTNFSVLDRIALYDGTTEIAEVPASATISFAGLTAAALDNTSKTLNLRATFKTSVTDNTQFSFTVNSASADVNGSIFGTANAGGAVSSTVGDNNRIEVTATTITWGTQPASQITNTNLTTVTVNAVDVNGNIDLDENTCTIALTTSGVGMTSTSPYTFVSGVVTMSDIQFSAANTAITLTATAQTCLSNNAATSNTFNITVFTYLAGDWRSTAANANFGVNSSGWESFNGTIWTTETTAPENLASAPSRIIIRHAGCDASDNVGTGTRTFQYNDIIIITGGELVLNGNKTGSITATWNPFLATGKKLEVQSGGILRVQGDIDMGDNTRSLNILDGGKMYLNRASIINTHMMWAGTEDFQDNSEIIIQNWDYTASVQLRSFLNPTYQIPVNSSGNGYIVGNLTYDYTPVTNNQTILPALTGPLKFCHNLTINNKSTTLYVSLTANKVQNPIASIGGNFILQQGHASIGVNYSKDGDQQIDILGNIDVQNINGANPSVLILHYFAPAYIGLALTELRVRLFGNLSVATGATLNTNVATDTASQIHTRLNFTGTSTQTITNTGTIELSNVHVKNAANLIIASGNFIATDSLIFDNGHIRLQGAADITLGSSTSPGVELGAGSSKYVSTESAGSYIKTQLANSTAYTFPIGTSLTSYNPITLNYTGTIDDFSARVEVGVNPTTSHDLEFVNRTWNISESVAGGTTASLTLQWDASHENSSFVRTTSNIFHYKSGAWAAETFLARAGVGPYTCSDNGITSFSPFIVGNNTVVLPVKLLSFKAQTVGKVVKLNWTTASEINNDYFDVEKSADGIFFNSISTQKGAGNSTTQNNYKSFDLTPNNGTNYYRLKQVDFNGESSYSSIIAVQFLEEKEPVLIQNNNSINIKNNFNNVTVYLYDISGRLMLKTNKSTINTNKLSKGIYTLRILSNTKEKHWKLIIN